MSFECVFFILNRNNLLLYTVKNCGAKWKNLSASNDAGQPFHFMHLK